MELSVYLKICEACGCLWYRSQLETRVYCTGCNERFKEFPTPQSRKRRGRPKKTTLPTVFAVQASGELISQERSIACNRPSLFESAGFTETPCALVASKSAAYVSGAAFLGGAN